MSLTPATLRLDLKGKRCGAGYIAGSKTCRLAERTPRSGAPVDWRRRAAIGAGLTAGALAIGLPAAAFLASGSAPGRRASMSAEHLARETAAGFRHWRGSPLEAAGMPLEMGFGAAAEGIGAARNARRRVESWRYAPGFAAEASRLGASKARSAAARRSYITQLQAAWAGQSRPATPQQQGQRAREVARETAKAERLARQAATRQRAARRAARIARTGSPWRSSPTPLESFVSRGLASPTPGPRGGLERSGAALTAGLLRQLQQSSRGLNRRRVRFYG